MAPPNGTVAPTDRPTIEAFELWRDVCCGDGPVEYSQWRRGFKVEPRESERLVALIETVPRLRNLWETARDLVSYSVRHVVCERYSWSVPCREALDLIAGLRVPILDPMAGNGYWPWLMAGWGIKVRASDRNPPDRFQNHWFKNQDLYYPVEEADVTEVVASARDEALFLSWPPMSDAGEKAVREYSGPLVILIGEVGGCTGSDGLEELLDAEWKQSQEFNVPQWTGIHDYGRVFER